MVILIFRYKVISINIINDQTNLTRAAERPFFLVWKYLESVYSNWQSEKLMTFKINFVGLYFTKN